MYKELSRLIMYSNIGEDSIIVKLGQIIREFDSGEYDSDDLTSRIFQEIHRLLEISTDYGFDKNLWHDYIAYILATNENPFSLTAEGTERSDGSVNKIVIRDMMIFNYLFNFNFSMLEEALGIDAFSIVTDYSAIHKRRQLYNRNVSKKVRALSDAIDENLKRINALKEEGKCEAVEAEYEAAEGTYSLVRDFYKENGVGMFGLNTAFRIAEVSGDSKLLEGRESFYSQDGGLKFVPINNTDKVMLDDLVGYELQKQKLRENTEAFLAGKPANNVLLFGDAGTGKSTSIKALINEYHDKGLRMIELYKHQMGYLSKIISSVKVRNYRFIIYMDDLSFEDNETEYKYLKAVIEGGLETRPDNVLIYATSNRRNLIRESWNDIKDIELDKHRSDTIQEKLSLVSRFGVAIPFMKPNKKEYEAIVQKLAENADILDEYSLQKLLEEANSWSLSHGGMSGRAAKQLIDKLMK